MSEQTFVRELERRADDVQPTQLRFEDVRASAHRIQRRRRIAASGAAAAVVAAVLLVPGLIGDSPSNDRPEPAPPGPTITPGQTVPFDLDVPEGDAPRVLYHHVVDSVAIDDDGEHDLPDGTSQVVPYGDGFLAVASGDNPTPVKLALYQLDASYEVVAELGPVGAAIRASPDGRRVAWIEVARNPPALLVVAEDGEVVQRLPLPDGNLGYPVGFTADGTVYNIEKLGADTWTWQEAVGEERTPVPHLGYVTDASPVSDLVVGTTRFNSKKNLPRAGAVSGSELLWEDCCYLLEDLSPDGSLVFGYPDEGTPSHQRLTVLDARTGQLLVEFDGGDRATVVEAAWEDDGHVLAVVEQGNRQAILRLGLDGTVERATGFERVDTLSVTWFLAGRPAE
jgi:hypothetical protein